MLWLVVMLLLYVVELSMLDRLLMILVGLRLVLFVLVLVIV